MIEDSNTAALEDESYDEEKEFLFESTQISLRPKTKNSFRSRLQGLRGILECAMLGVIALLLSMILRNAEASSLLTYGPTMQRKVTSFGNESQLGPDYIYSDASMFSNKSRMNEVYDNWQKLYPEGRGFIQLRQSDWNGIIPGDPPYANDIFNDGRIIEGHVLSVFHSIHCLGSYRSTTVLMVGLGQYPKSVEDTIPQHAADHQAHCLEYLRQSVLCNADTSLEGKGKYWQVDNGWGTLHTCTDYEALMRWTGERAGLAFNKTHKPF